MIIMIPSLTLSMHGDGFQGSLTHSMHEPSLERLLGAYDNVHCVWKVGDLGDCCKNIKTKGPHSRTRYGTL